MSDGIAFTCFGCGSAFAGFGVSVGSVDASLGAPGDLAAGAFCDACCGTWRPVTASYASVTALTAGEPLGRGNGQAALAKPLEVPLRVCGECGQPFDGRIDAVYCCGACRMRAHRRRREPLSVIDESEGES
jgi:hypothetical protein